MQALSANFKALQIQDVKEFGNAVDTRAIIHVYTMYIYIMVLDFIMYI